MSEISIRAYALASVVSIAVLVGCGGDGSGGDIYIPTIAKATLNNFIVGDPLNGDNGLPTSPAITISKYGPVSMGVDVDGNAIQAIDEQDLRYFEGHYYMYGTSFTCGAFNYAAGVNTGPLIPTNPGSLYRYCGLTTYQSDDMMNWKLLSTQYIQDTSTGEHYYVKKPRVVYSPKTKLYNLWFLNGQAALVTSSKVGKYFIAQSTSPSGPWSKIIEPTVAVGSFGPVDYSINTGPDGKSYIATSHAGVNVLQLNDEKTGTIDETQVNIAAGTLAGGIGISYNNGWWYITGSNGCGNCLAAKFYYLMAKNPHGPWLSPVDGSSTQPLNPGVLSVDSGFAQMHSAVMLPDSAGGTLTVIPGTHYRSSPTGAPGTSVAQPGDNNLATSGLYLTPLNFDAAGHILPLTITPSYELPLAKAVPASTPPTPPVYQVNLGVTNIKSIVQSWDVQSGDTVSAILPALFQRTPDMSPNGVATATVQQPNVNAPLLAKLELSDRRVYNWTIDPRTIAWAPTKIPLNLPEAIRGPIRATLTLSTTATNGGYGVAVGKIGQLPNSQYASVNAGISTTLPLAEMLLSTSSTVMAAPKITSQPRSIRVSAGTPVGFLVTAEGLGIGYQWYKNGQPILSPDGYNESTTAALRLPAVTAADAGVYTAVAFNQVGSVTTVPVSLEISQ